MGLAFICSGLGRFRFRLVVGALVLFASAGLATASPGCDFVNGGGPEVTFNNSTNFIFSAGNNAFSPGEIVTITVTVTGVGSVTISENGNLAPFANVFNSSGTINLNVFNNSGPGDVVAVFQLMGTLNAGAQITVDFACTPAPAPAPAPVPAPAADEDSNDAAAEPVEPPSTDGNQVAINVDAVVAQFLFEALPGSGFGFADQLQAQIVNNALQGNAEFENLRRQADGLVVDIRELRDLGVLVEQFEEQSRILGNSEANLAAAEKRLDELDAESNRLKQLITDLNTGGGPPGISSEERARRVGDANFQILQNVEDAQQIATVMASPNDNLALARRVEQLRENVKAAVAALETNVTGSITAQNLRQTTGALENRLINVGQKLRDLVANAAETVQPADALRFAPGSIGGGELSGNMIFAPSATAVSSALLAFAGDPDSPFSSVDEVTEFLRALDMAPPGRWSMWAGGSYSGFKGGGTGGQTAIVSSVNAGAAYRVNKNLTVGGAVRYRRGEADISSLSGDVDTNLFGVAATAEWVTDSGLDIDLMAAVDTGNIDIALAGVTGKTDLLSVQLSGGISKRIRFEEFWLEPNISITVGRAWRDGFATSDGTRVLGKTLNFGRVIAGPKIGARFAFDDGIVKAIEPSVGAGVFQDFGSNTPTGLSLFGQSNIAFGERSVFSLSGAYSGLSNNQHSWVFDAKVTIPLN